jgi:hypothetical protein
MPYGFERRDGVLGPEGRAAAMREDERRVQQSWQQGNITSLL